MKGTIMTDSTTATGETFPQVEDELRGVLKRTEIQHASSSIPGRDIVQVLTEIPVDVSSGWHHHPGEEVGYIVAGRMLSTYIVETGEPVSTLQT
jgi:quercetin dioxygenase-like cupin family protein